MKSYQEPCLPSQIMYKLHHNNRCLKVHGITRGFCSSGKTGSKMICISLAKIEQALPDLVGYHFMRNLPQKISDFWHAFVATG
jgi:hypothetical protein